MTRFAEKSRSVDPVSASRRRLLPLPNPTTVAPTLCRPVALLARERDIPLQIDVLANQLPVRVIG